MQKNILIIASLLGATAVMIGAFGAHGLADFLKEQGRTDTFETAVKYHFYHSLALLLLGVLMFHIKDPLLNYAGIAMFVGILIFSGSLYVLCLTGITKLGMVTPLGGLALIIGWLLIFWSVLKANIN